MERLRRSGPLVRPDLSTDTVQCCQVTTEAVLSVQRQSLNCSKGAPSGSPSDGPSLSLGRALPGVDCLPALMGRRSV